MSRAGPVQARNYLREFEQTWIKLGPMGSWGRRHEIPLREGRLTRNQGLAKHPLPGSATRFNKSDNSVLNLSHAKSCFVPGSVTTAASYYQSNKERNAGVNLIREATIMNEEWNGNVDPSNRSKIKQALLRFYSFNVGEVQLIINP